MTKELFLSMYGCFISELLCSCEKEYIVLDCAKIKGLSLSWFESKENVTVQDVVLFFHSLEAIIEGEIEWRHETSTDKIETKWLTK